MTIGIGALETKPEPGVSVVDAAGCTTGRLFVEDEKVVFEGDVEKSARIFFDSVFARWKGDEK